MGAAGRLPRGRLLEQTRPHIAILLIAILPIAILLIAILLIATPRLPA